MAKAVVPNYVSRLRAFSFWLTDEGRRYVTGPLTAVPPPVPHPLFGQLVIRGMDAPPGEPIPMMKVSVPGIRSGCVLCNFGTKFSRGNIRYYTCPKWYILTKYIITTMA